MKTLAIIPARSGSRGIEHKNLLQLGGQRLIDYTFEAAMKSTLVDHVFLVTDYYELFLPDELTKLKNINYYELPNALATNDVQVDEAVLFCFRDINWEYDDELIQHFDTVVVLQPTSPFRTAQHIDEALSLYETINEVHAIQRPLRPKESVISVWEPGWPYEVGEHGYIHSYSMRPHIRPSRQSVDEMKVVVENGAIYIVDAERLSNEKSFRSIVTTPYYMDKKSSIEIDEPIDLVIAEAILAYENSR